MARGFGGFRSQLADSFPFGHEVKQSVVGVIALERSVVEKTLQLEVVKAG